MRPLFVAVAALLACATLAVAPAGAAPKPVAPAASWAQPQITAVVVAGLLAPDVKSFAPQQPLTQAALGAALDALTLARQPRSTWRYRVVAPAKPVTIRELNAALVGWLGLGDGARAVATQLRTAGLAPKTGAGTEVVARLLGLRFNHPAGQDALEVAAGDPATRAEAAYSLARVLELSRWTAEWVRAEALAFALPQLTGLQQQVLRRAVSFVGMPYVWGGTSERPQQLFGQSVPGGFDCSGFIWRVFKLEPFPGASALATVLRGRTTFELSGEVATGQRITKPERLQPGDVIFQGDAGPKSKPAQVGHAGIYLGGGWFVHSSGSGTTLHPFAGWYRDRFAWARRPLREAGLS